MISSPKPNEATATSDSNEQHTQTMLSNKTLAQSNDQSGYRITPQEHTPQLENAQRRDEQDVDTLANRRAGTGQPLRGNWWQRFSLKNKATAMALALGVLPVLTIGTTSYLLTSKDIRDNAIQSQEQLSIALGHEIGSFMFERYGDIQALANLPTLNNPTGTVGVTLQQNRNVLNNFIKAYGVYDSIAVVDLSGNVVLESGESASKVDYKKIDYFQAAVRTKRPVISSVRKSTTSGKYSVFLAAPVFDVDTGKMISVVRTRIPAEALDTLIIRAETTTSTSPEDVRKSAAVEYHLVDGDGRIFAADEEEEVGIDATKEFPGFSQMQAAKKVRSTINAHISDGVEQLITYAPIQKAEVPQLNWSILLAENTTIVFAAQRRLLLTLLLGTGLTALVVGAIAAYIANRATRPLLAAAGVVEKLGQGDLDTRVAVEGQDELAVLGFNINRMAGQIQTLVGSQESQTEQAALFADIASFRTRNFQDLEPIFDEAVTRARELLKVDRVVVYLFKPDWSGYISAESVVTGYTKALADQINDPCISEELIKAYEHGRIVSTNNVFETNYSPDHLKLLSRLEVKANLVTPILQNEQLFGLLIAHQCSAPYVWQQFEINFLMQLATQVGLVLDRVGFVEQQSLATEKLQKRALELLMEVDPISRGDLTIRASVTEDEIGTVADSYNATVESLRRIVTQVQAAAQEVTTTTSSNTRSVQGLATEALRQTEEINAALNRIQEMSSSIKAVAKSAEQAEAAVQQANQTVEAGDAAMNRTVDGILAIRETVAETSKKVKRLGESSQKISKVVNLIGTFADKTNLLALNASIEAAHAGEQGRGFAVVADQVRALARQSAQATAEIETLVATIQTETNEVVAAMESGTEQVVEGTRLVDETRQSLNQITAASAQISALVEAIAAAAVTQTQTSESVTQTMTNVAANNNQTSNEASVVSASFNELLKVAQQLQASVAQFKVS